MHPILIMLFMILVIGGITGLSGQFVIGKHSSNEQNNSNVGKTDSKSDTQTKEDSTKSDVIPIEPPAAADTTVPPTTAPPPTTPLPPNCDESSDDKECTAFQVPAPPTTTTTTAAPTNPTVSTPEPPIVQQELAEALQNSPLLPTESDSGSSDNSGGSSTSGSGSSDNQVLADGQDHKSRIGPDSRFIIGQTNNGDFGLYSIIGSNANEKSLNVNEPPQHIRVVQDGFSSEREALQWLNDFDSR